MKIYNMTKTEHLRKRLTTDRLARQQTTKFRDFSPISTREAITASSVANAPCGGKNKFHLHYHPFTEALLQRRQIH